MAQDQKEVLKNLKSQQAGLQNTLMKLQQDLETCRNQYLQVTGAVDVLSQLLEEVTETEVTEQE